MNNAETSMYDLLDMCNNPPYTACPVELSTKVWKNGQGVHVTRSMLFSRSDRVAGTWFVEDVAENNAYYIIESITNIDECPDGIYDVHICDIVFCDMSGEVKDYSYKLCPRPAK